MPADGHPIPASTTRVHRHSVPIDTSTGRRVGQPANTRQAEARHRQAGEQAAPAPIAISGDWPAILAAVNASVNPSAALSELLRSTVAGASESLRQHTVTAMMPLVERAVQAARRDGFKAGKREGMAAGSVTLEASPALLEALRQPAPTVNVAPAAVTVENQVIVPARKVIAKTLPNGTVEMTPEDG